MCKIAGIFLKNDKAQKSLNSMMNSIVNEMLDGNSDAMGIVDFSSTKGILSVKKFHPETIERQGIYKLCDADLVSSLKHERFPLSKGTTFRMIHTRFATTAKTVENTHPFSRNGLHLIHNGVISNHDEFKKYISTCDSEAILTQYIDLDIENKPHNIEQLFSNLQGYMGCFVLNENKNYVDFFIRDAYVYLVDKPDYFALATSAGTFAKHKSKRVNSNQFIRIDLRTLETVLHLDKLPDNLKNIYSSTPKSAYNSAWDDVDDKSWAKTTYKAGSSSYSREPIDFLDYIENKAKRVNLSTMEEMAIERYYKMTGDEQLELEHFPLDEAWELLVNDAVKPL